MKKIFTLLSLSVLFIFKANAQVTCGTADCSDGSFFSAKYCITTPTCGGFTGDISAVVTTTMPNCTGCVEVLLTGTDNTNTRAVNVNISGGSATAGFSNIPEGFYVLTLKTPIVPTPPVGSTKTSYVCSKLISINAVDTLSINATLVEDPCPVVAPYQGKITNVSASGGNPPYIYDWADVPGTNNTPNRSGLQPGVTYTLTVTDSKGCTKTNNYVISEKKPSVSLTPSGPICDPSLPRTITWTATPEPGWTLNPGGSFSYNGGVSWTSSTTSPSQTANTYGSYTESVIFRDVNDCRANATAIVTLDTRPVFTAAANPTSVCPGATTDIAANITSCSSIMGATCQYSYDGGGTFSGSSTYTTPAINKDTTFTVRVQNSSGCYSDKLITVDTSGRPKLAVTVPTVCPMGAYTINVSCVSNCGGIQYNFNGSGFIAGSPQSYTQPTAPLVAATTSFPLIAKGSNNCQLDTTITVNIYQNTLAITKPADTTVCANNNGSTVTLTATGFQPATMLTWSTNPTGYPFDGSHANPIQAASPTSGTVVYTLAGTDTHGCPRTVSQSIVARTQPTVMVTGPAVHCEGTTSTLNATGAFTYEWYNITYTTLLSSPGSSYNVSPTVATSYSIIGTDANGCKDSTTYVLPFRSKPTGTASLSPATICSGNTTDVTITATSVFTPNAAGGYSVSDGTSYVGTTPSPYTVTGVGPFTSTTVINTKLRDDVGCESSSIPVTITVTPFNFKATVTNPTCNYLSNGSIVINNLVGGTSPNANYSLNGASAVAFTSTASITNLASNTYLLHVTDNSAPACSHDTTLVVVTPSALTLDTTVSNDVTCFGDANGSIPVKVTGGNPSFTYYIDVIDASPEIATTTNRTPAFTGLSAGVYDVIVQDAVGCKDTVLDVPINQPASAISAPGITLSPSCFDAATGKLQITSAATGGWGGYTYKFGPPTVSVTSVPATFPDLAPGSYSVSVTDQRGCVFSLPAQVITEYTKIMVDATVVSPDCNNFNGSLTVNGATGSVGPYTFHVNGSPYNTGTIISAIGPDSSILVHVDCTAGCSIDSTFKIRNIARSMPIVRYTPPTCPGGNDASITIDSMRVKNTSQPAYQIDLFQDTNPKVSVGSVSLPSSTSNGSVGSLTGGKYVMNLSDGIGGGSPCSNYPVDSFVLFTPPSTFQVVKAPYSGVNPGYAEVVIPEPAGFTTSSIALASDINESTGAVIVYNLKGGTPVPMGSKKGYYLAVDNPTSLHLTKLKDTLGNQTYVSFNNLAPGPHYIYIQDQNGCQDSIRLEVPGKFFIPNLVSPNGDSHNDVFEIVSLPDGSQVRIFNRWGDRVFESSNYDNKYDFKGLSDGVYYYDLEFATGTRFKGWVEVMH